MSRAAAKSEPSLLAVRRGGHGHPRNDGVAVLIGRIEVERVGLVVSAQWTRTFMPANGPLLKIRRHAILVLECGEIYQRAIQSSRLSIEDCGHMPEMERPAEFAWLVEDFLAG
jgi:pimeloyl-ACP methyl ester carboxylesterase